MKSNQSTHKTMCVVMPAYNEEGCIENVVRSWCAVAKEHDGSFLVINDGSRDNTGKILDRLDNELPELKVIHQANAGHGIAVLRGYNEAVADEYEWIFQTDSDDQFSPNDFRKLWVKKNEAVFIAGYRKVRHDALHRLVITRIVRLVNLILFGVYIKDANVPYRLMRRDFLEESLAYIPAETFAPNIFLSVLARKKLEHISVIPISHLARATGIVSIMKYKLLMVCMKCVKQAILFRISLALKRKNKETFWSNTGNIH